MNRDFFVFWGKAEKAGSSWHPAVCHMLDVGIVARSLLAFQSPQIQKRLLALFGPSATNTLALIAALHDIGKISPGFQSKRADLCKSLEGLGFGFPKFATSNHGKIAASCLSDLLQEELYCPEESASVLSHVLAAHHGVFVGPEGVLPDGHEWDSARRDIIHFLAEIFEVESLKYTSIPSTADALLLAGLLTVADWLGSSEEHFSYVGTRHLEIPTYIGDCCKRAQDLVKGQWTGSFVKSEKSFIDLFPFPPNPCQEAVLNVTNSLQHPMLIIVESPMGTGKTEAAQAAYSILASRNDLRGMYYALPTQATGNAMFPRMRSFLEKLDVTGQAELHLIHANADLNPAYEELKLNSINNFEGNVVASSWFTARKRGILAGYGTGTIDQALLSVLRVRHFFLRLFGLSGKLLILDEVHAYDAYMTEEIFRLIGWLSNCASSVVLLSATLPKARRQKLIEAFSPSAIFDATPHYPCVIGVDVTGNVEWEEIKGLEESGITFSPVISSQKEKTAKSVHLLKEKLADGGCAACILNTVSDAQTIYDAVIKEIHDAKVILFHSRFTLGRRLAIEEQILSYYGKNGTRPQKGIVVATQVIEQSLDVDFDLMISDLAPIDLLFKRAGRLHRHSIPRLPLLRERILYVLMPDIFTANPDFGGSRYVYFPDVLLKTALLFADQDSSHPKTIYVPYGVSSPIEAVYGDEEFIELAHIKDNLSKWVEERLGKELAHLFAAREVSLLDVRSCIDDPLYIARLTNNNDDERMISSRLARQNVTLVVLKQGDNLSLHGREDVRKLYGKSIVTDNIHLVKHFQSHEPPVEWKDIPLLRHCRPLIFTEGKMEVGTYLASYDDDVGLRIARKTEVT